MRTTIGGTPCHDPGALNAAGGQCFVCEKAIAGDHWHAQAKHGDWTVRLCCPQCAEAFYAQRLPRLRCAVILAAMQSLRRHALRAGGWPDPLRSANRVFGVGGPAVEGRSQGASAIL